MAISSVIIVSGCGSDTSPQGFSSDQSKTIITAINQVDGMVAAGKCRMALRKQQQLTIQTRQLFPPPSKTLQRATLKSLEQFRRLIKQDCEPPMVVHQPEVKEPVAPLLEEPEAAEPEPEPAPPASPPNPRKDDKPIPEVEEEDLPEAEEKDEEKGKGEENLEPVIPEEPPEVPEEPEETLISPPAEARP